MRHLWLSLIVLVAVPAVRGADVPLTGLQQRLNQEYDSWSPTRAVERAAEHLATVPEKYRSQTRYFDLSDVPRKLLPAATASLHFWCNSMSSGRHVNRPQPVPNTDNRLYWIYLDWYKWTPKAWEEVALEDPYFREPIVPSNSTGLYYLKATTVSNPIIRGSWFVYYSSDTSLFLKPGEVRADNAFYYRLLYAQSKFTRKKDGKEIEVKGEPPENETEFQQHWKVDLNILKDFPIDKGAIVDEGASGVALQNRVLWRVRTPIGHYWKTFDVFATVGDQDFVETLFPKKVDAGEHIAVDDKGAQHYLLTNGEGQRTEFADPRAARDRTDQHRGIVVTAKSCAICHSEGIRPFQDDLTKLLESGVDLRTKDYAAERIETFFLGNLERLVKRDNEDYSDFVAACNGLDTETNATQFNQFRSWYELPITLDQASRELGSTPVELEAALSRGTKGRLGRLTTDRRPIPRVTWERGLFQEAGLLLLEHRKRPTVP